MNLEWCRQPVPLPGRRNPPCPGIPRPAGRFGRIARGDHRRQRQGSCSPWILPLNPKTLVPKPRGKAASVSAPGCNKALLRGGVGTFKGVGNALVLFLELAARKPGLPLRVIKGPRAVQLDLVQGFHQRSFCWELDPQVCASNLI